MQVSSVLEVDMDVLTIGVPDIPAVVILLPSSQVSEEFLRR
jgi:hypothetical protein